MKSSGSVFARKNPFTPASSVRRAHHPSRKQSLPKTDSPVHPSQSSRKQCHSQNGGSQQLQESHDGGDVFTEIWPTTDYRSSPEMLACDLPARPETSTVSSGVQDDSVMAKHIERFGHSQPQKRQQVAGEEQMPFGWMFNSSVHSSTPTKASNSDGSPAGPHHGDRSISILSDSSQGVFDDTEILRLQEKARTLLLRGAQSDGSVPVSSDGLGCSDVSSPVTADEPVRRPLMKPFAVSSDSVHAASSQKSTVHVLGPPTRPEEDILFQWRLRRKMEQARDRSWFIPRSNLQDPAFNWQAPTLIQPTTSGQPHTRLQFPQRDAPPHIPAPQSEITNVHRQRDPDSSPLPIPSVVISTSPPSQPHVPAHRHLLCDILPCPIHSSHAQEKLNMPQRLDEPQTKVIHKEVQVPERSSRGENGSSSPHVSPGTVEGEARWPQKVSEKSKSSREADRKQRKASRASLHHRCSEKVTPLREQHQQEGSREVSCENGDPEALPSPVHAALGQAVSEVLFPVADSSPAQKIRVSLPHTVPTASHSPPPSGAAQNSLEVISQLLQEAEDSDEHEFEDDPLLKVLRQQRKWVRDQIGEVDLMLGELPQEQHLT
ncbi:proline and serine-rich protein 3 isoform X1 [Nothobranchius furzeri]|uniref:proline and serine-rich protein 3 isoform X1 n=1 Tax=Nothobranchius furzeri TaxID=105023 RepID=UPI00390488DC